MEMIMQAFNINIIADYKKPDAPPELPKRGTVRLQNSNTPCPAKLDPHKIKESFKVLLTRLEAGNLCRLKLVSREFCSLVNSYEPFALIMGVIKTASAIISKKKAENPFDITDLLAFKLKKEILSDDRIVFSEANLLKDIPMKEKIEIGLTFCKKAFSYFGRYNSAIVDSYTESIELQKQKIYTDIGLLNVQVYFEKKSKKIEDADEWTDLGAEATRITELDIYPETSSENYSSGLNGEAIKKIQNINLVIPKNFHELDLS